ncbi:uncharacterized protein RAG0_02350 [Rhynchosporium agropyri]|uniref:Uncharacterized protein n=1 Tax=Rhynchosporium agropyri TaxID=914238 RepID=A0A1E1K1R4_9HELO|nr:uncharacterized protein RAG0_02350 [Rhynchosporium agropyri]
MPTLPTYLPTLPLSFPALLTSTHHPHIPHPTHARATFIHGSSNYLLPTQFV